MAEPDASGADAHEQVGSDAGSAVGFAEAADSAGQSHSASVPGLRFSVLGPVRLTAGAEPVPIGSAGARALLMMLVLHANQIVSIDRIVDGLWGEDPPATARTIVHGYVSRLRRILASVDQARETAAIITHPPGYELQVDDWRVDVHEVRQLLVKARGRPARERAELLRAAAGRWRGPLEANPPTEAVTVELDDLHMVVSSERIEADLELGRHAELVGELRNLVRQHPFDEGLVGQLMRALYRCGQRVDALECYYQFQARVGEELGIDAGPQLRALHESVLRDDPILRVPAAHPAPSVASPVRHPGAVVPAQLPPTTTAFIGREAELAWLDRLLGGRDQGNTRIVVVTGAAGVGKSALALQWAHRCAREFPDGVLFAALRAFDPTHPVVSTSEVLTRFLLALGVRTEEVPRGLDEQTALYRSLLAARRVLVVLDDARDADHVRPLLPGAPGSLVLVTSRRRLDGLLARTGARLLPLATLPAEQAARVIENAASDADVELTAEQAARLAALCDNLPLALRAVAARLAIAPAQTAAGLLAELSDERTRLSAMDLEDADTSVRAALDVSYRGLPAVLGDTFRMMGVIPGAAVDHHVLAAVCGVDLATARRRLRALAEANLVSEAGTNRFVRHDLVRLHGRELAMTELGESEVAAARDRLCSHYLASADLARRLLRPPYDELDFSSASAQIVRPVLTTAAQAVSWFEMEWPNLSALLHDLAAIGWHRLAWQLVALSAHYLTTRTSYAEWLAWARTGLASARAAGDDVGEVLMLIMVASAQSRYGQAGQNLADARNALHAATELGDPRYIRRALGNMAGAFYDQGRFREALGCDQEAYRLAVDAADQLEQARALGDMSRSEMAMGRGAEAIAHAQSSAELLRELNDIDGYRYALANLAELYLTQDRTADAEASISRVLELSFGNRPDLQYAFVRELRGRVLHRRGDRSAADELRAALRLSESLGSPRTVELRALLAEWGVDGCTPDLM